ncbi:MAG: hypothetical protein R3Y67_07255 [Eubacteriales bacterium]
MKKLRYFLIGLVVITAILGLATTLLDQSVPMDHFLAIAQGESSSSILAWYDDKDTVVAQVDENGIIEKYISYQTEVGNVLYTVQGIAVGTGGSVYVLRNQSDAYTGDLIVQELMILDFSGWYAKEQKVFTLTDTTENYYYRTITASADTVSLVATDMYEETAIRRTYEYGTLLAGTLTIKSTRTYPLMESEGIYQAVGNGTDLAYLSDSGKIFVSTETTVTEVYPARVIETLIYPTFLVYAESGYIYMGEHETGNFIRLNLSDGTEEILQSGNSPLNGATTYTTSSISKIAMTDTNNYLAVVTNTNTGKLELILTTAGLSSVIDSINYGLLTIFTRFLLTWLLYAAIVFGIIGLVAFFRSVLLNGRTIMARLVAVAVPLIALALGLFGFIAYNYYEESIQTNFEKQVLDEGNMLMALFGQSSFNEIQYPYDYNNEAYQYLVNQLQTRDIYARVGIYEAGDLYITVDEALPCYYPASALMNQGLEELYAQAAVTGIAVTGVIQDSEGERFVCVTPLGGLSGQTVYLLETGIYTANIDNYMESYIKNFVIICISFLVIILVVLSYSFYKVLEPIATMKELMERYVHGDLEVRIDAEADDELSSISNIFNKLADDIDVLEHNHKKMAETYYRFVPTGLIRLLEKDNLADLTLGNKMEGEYIALQAKLDVPIDMPLIQVEKITNRYFTIMNEVAAAKDIIPIVDSSDLRTMTMLCKQDTAIALSIALQVLARVDSDNAVALEGEMCQVRFVIHYTSAVFTLCGDSGRYLPVLFAPELDSLEEQNQYFHSTNSRILMTDVAVAMSEEMELYANRYISTITVADNTIGLYDVFEDRSSNEIRIMKQTSNAFVKAIELYEKGFYYEAKNMFAMVFRENSNDYIARLFLFKCEELQHETQNE